MMIGRLIWLLSLSALVGCSAAAPEPVLPENPRRSLSLAFKPGSCVAGANTLPVSASVLGPEQRLRYLEPKDGKLQFALVLADRSESPIDFRWLEVPALADRTPLPLPAWNLELSFNSPHAGECPIHVEFHPSAEAVGSGLRMAETTIVMTEPPPPPPFADAFTPRGD